MIIQYGLWMKEYDMLGILYDVMDKLYCLVFYKQWREFEWFFLVYIGCIFFVFDIV